MMKTNEQTRWRRIVGAMLFFFQMSLVAAFAQESGARSQEIVSPRRLSAQTVG